MSEKRSTKWDKKMSKGHEKENQLTLSCIVENCFFVSSSRDDYYIAVLH